MKTILLLAFAVFVSGAPLIEENTSVKEEKTLLRELVHNLETAKKNLPKEPEVRFNFSIVTIVSQNCLYI